MVTERSHYSILGVDQFATPEQIRRAYRELARQLHPDMTQNSAAGQSSRPGVSMAEVNRAWNVLSDPVTRREYDRTLRGASDGFVNSGPMRETTVSTPPASLPPVRFPWRAMVVVAIVASAIVLVLNGLSDPPAPGVPDQLLEAGSCVVIDREMFAVEVSCSSPHEYVVRQFIAIDRSCPADSESYRDRQGMGVACVDRVVSSSSVATGATTR